MFEQPKFSSSSSTLINKNRNTSNRSKRYYPELWDHTYVSTLGDFARTKLFDNLELANVATSPLVNQSQYSRLIWHIRSAEKIRSIWSRRNLWARNVTADSQPGWQRLGTSISSEASVCGLWWRQYHVTLVREADWLTETNWQSAVTWNWDPAPQK